MLQRLTATVRRGAGQLASLRSLALGQYLRMAVGIVASPFLARALGPADRGVWALVATFDVTTTLVLASGMPRALGYFALRADRDDPSPVREANGALLAIAGRSGALAFVALVGVVVFDAVSATTLACVALLLSTPSTALNLAARQLAAMRNRDRVIPLIDSGPAVAQALAIITLFLVDRLTLTTGLIAYVCTSALAGLPAFLVWPTWVRTRPTAAFTSYARRSLPTNLGQLMQTQVDKLAVLTIGREALGVYAVGATIGNAVTPLYQAAGTDRFRDTSPGAVRRGRLRLAAFWGISVLLGVVAYFVVPVLYGQAYADARVVALVLCVGSIGFGMFLIERAVLDASGRPDASSAVTIAHVVAMICVVPLTARQFGLIPAAIATSGLQVLRGVLAMGVSRRVTRRDAGDADSLLYGDEE